MRREERKQDAIKPHKKQFREVMRAVVKGIGHSLPIRIMKNSEFTNFLETSDSWITQRTGISQRHIAGEGETTVSLGTAAARQALSQANLTPDDIDLIVLATSTPDNTFPASAVSIQHNLGMSHGYAFDLQAVCTGFVYALTTANLHLVGGQARRALVIGSETFSRILDWEDRTTCVLFGDGAGAMVLEAQDGDPSLKHPGVIACSLRSDGVNKDKLYVDGGPSSTQTVGHLRMSGREVFKHAVAMIADVVEDVLDKAGIGANDIDWFVPHQANVRIIDASGKKLGIAPEKIVKTVGEHGNTSAASVPLALSVAVSDGRIKSGDLVLVEAMGGGFTWGAALIRW